MVEALASLNLQGTDSQDESLLDVQEVETESVIDSDDEIANAIESVLPFFLSDTESLPDAGTTIRFHDDDDVWFGKVRDVLIQNGAPKSRLSVASIVRGCVTHARQTGLLEQLIKQTK